MNLVRIASRVALTQPLSERPDYGSAPAVESLWDDHIAAVSSAVSVVERLGSLGLVDSFNRDPRVRALLARMYDDYVRPMTPLWQEMVAIADEFARVKE